MELPQPRQRRTSAVRAVLTVPTFDADPAVVWFAIGGTALIFGVSGVLKLRDIGSFRDAVAGYRLMPEWFAPMLAPLVPAAEILLAVGLVYTPTRGCAGLGLLLLLGIFTLAILANLLRGRRDVDCGCFGFALRQELSWWLPARNALLAIVVAMALASVDGRALGALDLVTIAFGAAMLAILYYGAGYVLANASALHAPRL